MAKSLRSEAEKEYQKERRRLLQAVRRGEAKGFIYPEDIVPPIPKHVTKRELTKIKSITPTKLYKKAQWLDVETGELVSGTTKLKQEKAKTVKQKSSKSDIKAGTRKARFSVQQKSLLTPEQRHEISVKAGKKAWETRVSKMTPSEYQDFIKKFVERMKVGKERKRTSELPIEKPRTNPAIDRWNNRSQYWDKQEEPITPKPSDVDDLIDRIDRLDKQIERLQDASKGDEPFYPTISVVDKVREKVENLERVYSVTDNLREELASLKREVPPRYPIDKRKGELLRIFDEQCEYYGDDISQYEEYLIRKSGDIDLLLDVIRYDSKEENIERSFVQLAVLLNEGSLSPWSAERLSAMSELYGDNEEY